MWFWSEFHSMTFSMVTGEGAFWDQSKNQVLLPSRKKQNVSYPKVSQLFFVKSPQSPTKCIGSLYKMGKLVKRENLGTSFTSSLPHVHCCSCAYHNQKCMIKQVQAHYCSIEMGEWGWDLWFVWMIAGGGQNIWMVDFHDRGLFSDKNIWQRKLMSRKKILCNMTEQRCKGCK